MPSTLITAILLELSLSSKTTSSNLGPPLRCDDCAAPRLISWEKKWPMLNSTLIPSNTSKISAKTIQPRPLRGGRDGAGGTMTGGGVAGEGVAVGGGGGPGGGFSGGNSFVSI